jgi:hypothetical protein
MRLGGHTVLTCRKTSPCTDISDDMEYRGVEYHVAQAVEVGTWKVSTSLERKTRTIKAKSRKNAVIAAEHLIDKALAPKKRRLVKLID